MARPTISSQLKACAALKTRKEKVEFLKANHSVAMQHILMCMYDKKRVKWRIPNTPPPYNKSELMDNEGMIHREIRKLPYMVEGQGGDGLPQYRREQLFIQLLENVHADDAELLVQMLAQKPIEGIDKGIINDAFPGTVGDQR